MTFAFFYRASLGGPDECREQKFATLVGDHFGMSPTNILLTRNWKVSFGFKRGGALTIMQFSQMKKQKNLSNIVEKNFKKSS
ncbi:hypothetical protein ABH20_17055 [Geobacillus sp. T6]|nr:hypothetical protein ABH20_17055 [Geobacillus sp. T6]